MREPVWSGDPQGHVCEQAWLGDPQGVLRELAWLEDPPGVLRELAWLGEPQGALRGPARLGAVRLIAIDGPSGSGKSVLADRLVAGLRAAGCDTGLVRTDDFATWDDPVSWWPRLVDGVLDSLAHGQPGGYRGMEWVNGVPRPGLEVAVQVPAVLVLEGVSAGRRSIRRRLSGLIWCEHADAAERLERAVERDGEECREHLEAWQRFERGWFAVDDPRAAATLTVPS